MHLLAADDEALYGKYAGQALKAGDEELLVMREAGITAVLQIRASLQRIHFGESHVGKTGTVS